MKWEIMNLFFSSSSLAMLPSVLSAYLFSERSCASCELLDGRHKPHLAFSLLLWLGNYGMGSVY